MKPYADFRTALAAMALAAFIPTASGPAHGQTAEPAKGMELAALAGPRPGQKSDNDGRARARAHAGAHAALADRRLNIRFEEIAAGALQGPHAEERALSYLIARVAGREAVLPRRADAPAPSHARGERVTEPLAAPSPSIAEVLPRGPRWAAEGEHLIALRPDGRVLRVHAWILP